LKYKAIEFAKQGLSQTHLALVSYKNQPVLAGYFTLANKYISVSQKILSNNLRSRLMKFSTFDVRTKLYTLSAPLIAQLGKNYTDNYSSLLKGDDLLSMACNKIKSVQFELGGRFTYVECEDKPKLIEFYKRNGFYEFDYRVLDLDETSVSGERLIQLLRYIS
jgi:hypothetical protein